MPVRVLYGDTFLVAAALRELRQEVGPPEVWEANTHRLSASEASPASLAPVCQAMPFLAEKRLVVVEGALSAAQPWESRGRSRAAANWGGLGECLEGMPDTTLLVFADGPIRGQNPLLGLLKPLAQVREMPTPVGEALARWIRTAAAERGAPINPGAINLLTRVVGPNLWALDSELEKLALYAAGRPITEGHVRELVTQAREATIFNVVDGLLEGKPAASYRAMARLREGGAEFSYVIAMLARQLRQVVLARELLDHGHPPGEVGSRLHIGAEFALRKTVEQARRHSPQVLARLYEGLLEADLAVKQGRQDEGLALQFIINQAPVIR